MRENMKNKSYNIFKHVGSSLGKELVSWKIIQINHLGHIWLQVKKEGLQWGGLNWITCLIQEIRRRVKLTSLLSEKINIILCVCECLNEIRIINNFLYK